MASIQSANKSAKIKSATRAVICYTGLLALIASIFVLVAPSVSAVPTAGTRTSASALTNIKVAPPSSGNAPSLQFSFATTPTTNASRCRPGTTRWIYADNSMLQWSLTTNYDPTPSVVSAPNSDQIDCTYTVTITSNLENCTFSVNRGTGSPTTATSFNLVGSDSPNYSNGTGAFDTLGADKTVTITPGGCTAPTANPTQRLVLVRNLESQERYDLKFTPFGNCSRENSPGNLVEKSSWYYAVLDLKCNWQMQATPLDNIQISGCRVDAILYYADGTQAISPGAGLFIHSSGTSGNFAGTNGKQLARVDLMASVTPSGTGACEEIFRLTLRVDLPTNLNVSFYRDEKVGFIIEPFDNRQNSQCTQRMRVTSSNSRPTTTNIVKSPAGVTTTCSYTVTADPSATSLRVSTVQVPSRSFDTMGATQTTLAFLFVANRLPVQVSTQIFTEPGSYFTTDDRITLLVSVPGACGDDTALFGGVTGRRGLAYGVFVTPGVSGVIGRGSSSINPSASYDLPPYLFINGVQTPCVLRVTQASAYEGCTMRNPRRDASGLPYQEVAWTSLSTTFSITVQYDCVGSTSGGGTQQIALPRGWVMLPFNGATGTTASSFRRSLNNAFTSLWLWNPQTQSWRGWSTSSSTTLRMDKGDVVFVYVPLARTVRYNPADLLQPTASGGTKVISSGYSLLAYAGSTSTSLNSLLGARGTNIRLVFRWNNSSQSWSYFIPRGQPVVTSAQWFDTINPGDTVFVLNGSRSATTIRWP